MTLQSQSGTLPPPRSKKEVPPRRLPHTIRSLLTQREEDVLEFVVLRRTNKEIAVQLGISVGTVKTHVHSLLRKTNCHSRRLLVLSTESYAQDSNL
jgi:DNA-binding NarL/FixJ family response regulator